MDKSDCSRIIYQKKNKIIDIYDTLIRIKIDKMSQEKNERLANGYEEEINDMIEKQDKVIINYSPL